MKQSRHMSRASTEAASPARQRILDTAMRLFYREGLRATGIDRIIAESGVAKMSFYRHFPSKADLIAAFLKARHDWWMDWFTKEVEARLAKPGKGLEVLAEALGAWFRQPDFRGCAFINAVAESGTASSEERRLAVEHKDQLAVYVESIAKRLHLARPRQVAEAAMIILEGAIVRAQMTADPHVAAVAQKLLKNLAQSAAKV